MDQRQTKIIEGAGLEESRLNTDFIRWLQKWGTPLLLVLCLAAGGYSAWNWWQRAEQRAMSEAHAQLVAAQASGSPDGLLRVAREHASRGAIPEMATISAADVYLNSAMARLAPGGKAENEADKLNDEQRRANLEQAKTLYAEVAAKIGANHERAILALNARFGEASALATLGDSAGAMKALDAAAEYAKAANLPGLAEKAARSKADLQRAASLPALYTKEQVAASARPKPPAPVLPAPLNPGADPTALPDPGPLGPLTPDASPPVPPPAAEPGDAAAASPPAAAPSPAPAPPSGGGGASDAPKP